MVIGSMPETNPLIPVRKTVQKIQALGPAMTALEPRWRTFVILLWENQPISATEAYMRSGYNASRDAAQVSASRLLQDPRIKAAIIEYGRAYSAVYAPELHGILMGIARKEGGRDQAKVALAMLKHAGFIEQIEQTMNVNINVTVQEKVAFLREQMLADGMTEKQIEEQLGTVAAHEVVDAEFAEVEDKFADVQY